MVRQMVTSAIAVLPLAVGALTTTFSSLPSSPGSVSVCIRLNRSNGNTDANDGNTSATGTLVSSSPLRVTSSDGERRT